MSRYARYSDDALSGYFNAREGPQPSGCAPPELRRSAGIPYPPIKRIDYMSLAWVVRCRKLNLRGATMTYPASPNDVAPNRVRPDSSQFWAGGVATAVVAALIALVGILVCRWTLGIPILAPASDGAWGNAHTGEYVLVAACAALVATGLLYLLVLAAPQPAMFCGWIMGLVTLVAVVYPFSTGAPLEQKAATAVVNLVLGVA